VFGIQDKDTGRVFNPDDDGHLVYDKSFDFLDEKSQLWLNDFINKSIASRRDLFLVDDIVSEWKTYLFQMQMICSNTLDIDETKMNTEIFLPYPRKKLSKCRDEVNDLLVNSTVENFENLMSSFPRRIVFMANGSEVNGLLLRINANRTFIDYETVRDYYLDLKQFHEEQFAQAPDGFKSAWFISIAFALYDLQYQLITGTYSSLVASMAIALIILLLTSGNIFISLFAIVTISFSIADTIAVFVFLGWDLSILESVVIIMSVGLSVDFSCHYGVAYINADVEAVHGKANSSFCSGGENNQEENGDSAMASKPKRNSSQSKSKEKCKFVRNFVRCYRHNNKERFVRINDIFSRVGSAVLMAAFTTFLAGLSMFPSSLVSFSKMGQFLVLVMCFSYMYATFFFVPMCALFGPTNNFGNLKIKDWTVKLFRSCLINKNKKSSNDNSITHNNSIAINSTNKASDTNNTIHFSTNTSKV
jgi:predicted RND superfamily exporter protein